MGQMATQMSSSFASLASAMHVDASAFANAVHFNMDAEDLSSLMMSYAKASKLTYDNNLTTLGYADEADPISVKIFPRDFEAKERVLDHIDAYNKQVKATGHDEQAIAALMDGCAAGVQSCIAVVKALAGKHGYHTAEID